MYTPARRVISAVFNKLPQILFGARLQDAGGTKLGIREVFDYNLISRSPFFEAERIILAQRQGLRVEFVPIQFLTRPGGKAMGASARNSAHFRPRPLPMPLEVRGPLTKARLDGS